MIYIRLADRNPDGIVFDLTLRNDLAVNTVVTNDADAMRMLVGLNEHQGLRYIRTGMKHFPLWSLVEPLAVRLHQAVATEVG